MKLIKLLAVSLVPLYLLNLNNAYTMESNSKQNIMESNSTNNSNYTIKSKNKPDLTDFKNASTYNSDNDIKFYNPLIFINKQIVDDMKALITLIHLLSVTSTGSMQNFNLHYYLQSKQDAEQNANKIYIPVKFLQNILSNKWNLVSQEQFEDLKLNKDIIQLLQNWFNLLQNSNVRKVNISSNPIINLESDNNDSQVDLSKSDMNPEKLEQYILNQLKNMNYTNEVKTKEQHDLNKIQNIFLNIKDFESLKYFYNAICYGENNITIGNNTFELAGAALVKINRDGSQLQTYKYYVAAKKRSKGQWALIDSVDQNGKPNTLYADNRTYNDLDHIITRSENVDSGSYDILYPQLLIFRRVNTDQKKENKELNKNCLENINHMNSRLFDILKGLEKQKFKYTLGCNDDLFGSEDDAYHQGYNRGKQYRRELENTYKDFLQIKNRWKEKLFSAINAIQNNNTNQDDMKKKTSDVGINNKTNYNNDKIIQNDKIGDNNIKYGQLTDGIKVTVALDNTNIPLNAEIIVFRNPPKDFKPMPIHFSLEDEKSQTLEVSAENGKFVISGNNELQKTVGDFCILLYNGNYYLGCWNDSAPTEDQLSYFDPDYEETSLFISNEGIEKIGNNTNNTANTINTKLSANEIEADTNSINNNSINNININNINSFNKINDNNNSININNINTDYKTINNNSIKNNNIKNENNNNRINNQIDKKSNNKNVFFDKSISNTSQNKRISEIEKEINKLQKDIQNAETSTSESYSDGVTAKLSEDDKKTIKDNLEKHIIKHRNESSKLANLSNKPLKEQLSYFYREYLNYLCKNINARMKEMGMEFDPNFGPNNEFLRDILQTMFYNYINDHNGILVLFEYDNNTAKPIIDLLKKQDELNTLKQELKEVQNNNNK